jgi:hypothetical protein
MRKWRAQYVCIDCSKTFKLQIVNDKGTFWLEITYSSEQKHVTLVKKSFKTRCTGEERERVAIELSAYGIANTQYKNIISNIDSIKSKLK